MSLPKLRKSLQYALRGIGVVFAAEQSFRIQAVCALAVILLAAWFGVTSQEWIILVLMIGMVLSLEIMNSIFERMVDLFKPRIHPIVRDVKDMMAATVLVISFLALFVGAVIFYPHVIALVGG